MERMSKLTEYLALSIGSSYIDIGPISALRPDGAMARFTKKARSHALIHERAVTTRSLRSQAGTIDEDCLHSCLPGPVDTWSRLLLSLIQQRFSRPLSGEPHPAPVSVRTGSRFFQVQISACVRTHSQ